MLVLLLVASCSPPPPEAPRIDEQRIVVNRVNAPMTAPTGGYFYAVRSRLSAIGVLRADGFARQETESFAKALAHELDACVTREFSRGSIEAGATRAEVTVNKEGRVTHIDLSSEPQAAHAGALLCLISPLHAIGFNAGTDRLMTVEALWGSPKK